MDDFENAIGPDFTYWLSEWNYEVSDPGSRPQTGYYVQWGEGFYRGKPTCKVPGVLSKKDWDGPRRVELCEEVRKNLIQALHDCVQMHLGMPPFDKPHPTLGF